MDIWNSIVIRFLDNMKDGHDEMWDKETLQVLRAEVYTHRARTFRWCKGRRISCCAWYLTGFRMLKSTKTEIGFEFSIAIMPIGVWSVLWKIISDGSLLLCHKKLWLLLELHGRLLNVYVDSRQCWGIERKESFQWPFRTQSDTGMNDPNYRRRRFKNRGACSSWTLFSTNRCSSSGYQSAGEKTSKMFGHMFLSGNITKETEFKVKGSE